MRAVLLALLAIVSLPTSLAGQTVNPRWERATVAALFASSSVSMVPVWITAACTTAGTCREVNPVMRKLIGAGPTRAILVKSGISFATHYTIWRLPARTKTEKIVRLALAAMTLAVNGFDAVHDVRTLRRIESRRLAEGVR